VGSAVTGEARRAAEGVGRGSAGQIGEAGPPITVTLSATELAAIQRGLDALAAAAAADEGLADLAGQLIARF